MPLTCFCKAFQEMSLESENMEKTACQNAQVKNHAKQL